MLSDRVMQLKLKFTQTDYHSYPHLFVANENYQILIPLTYTPVLSEVPLQLEIRCTMINVVSQEPISGILQYTEAGTYLVNDDNDILASFCNGDDVINPIVLKTAYYEHVCTLHTTCVRNHLNALGAFSVE